MGEFLSVFATTPQRTSPMRAFQVLSYRDRPRLEAFFLAFDVDQRHEYFGARVSDEQIRDYCRAIHWNETCDRQPMVADLLDLAFAAASLSYSQIVIQRERAMPELLALLHPSPFAIFDVDVVRIDVPCYSAKIVAC
jgi:hypothetical protein